MKKRVMFVTFSVALLACVAQGFQDSGKKDDPVQAERKKLEGAWVEVHALAKEKPKGDPIKYTGRVFDKDTDKGVPNATVTVRRSTYGDPKHERVIEESKHTTNAEGKYTFTVPPEQAAERYLYIELDVAAPGYAPRSNFGYSFAMIQKNEKLGGRPFFRNADVHGLHLRVLTEPLGHGRVVQLAQPLTEVDSLLSRLRVILALLDVGGIALAALLGRAVAGAAILPLKRLTQAAEHVALTQDLSGRIEPVGEDEIGAGRSRSAPVAPQTLATRARASW